MKITCDNIVIFICIVAYIYINFKMPDSFLSEHLDDLQNGTIHRTPLLQAGQTIITLPHGVNNLTVKSMEIGNLGNGTVTKLIGICSNGKYGPTFT